LWVLTIHTGRSRRLQQTTPPGHLLQGSIRFDNDETRVTIVSDLDDDEYFDMVLYSQATGFARSWINASIEQAWALRASLVKWRHVMESGGVMM
jgi:hypothetical protein